MHQFVSSPKIRRKKVVHSFFEVINREVWCLDQSSERKVCVECSFELFNMLACKHHAGYFQANETFYPSVVIAGHLIESCSYRNTTNWLKQLTTHRPTLAWCPCHSYIWKQKSQWNKQQLSCLSLRLQQGQKPGLKRKTPTTGPLYFLPPTLHFWDPRDKCKLYQHLKLPKWITTCTLADHPVTFHACVASRSFSLSPCDVFTKASPRLLDISRLSTHVYI